MRGLSKAEVAERLKKYGYNELASAKPKNIGRIAILIIPEIIK